jgi:hypothetical protein
LETDLNYVPQCQKFSGSTARRRRGARHQQGTADAGVPGKTHRRRSVPRFCQHTKPGIQAAASAALEEGSDRPDDGSTESHQAADLDTGVEGHVWIQQGCVSQEGIND